MDAGFWRDCFLAVGIALLTGAVLGLFLCWWWEWLEPRVGVRSARGIS